MKFEQACWSEENARAGLKALDDGAQNEDLGVYAEWLASCWPKSSEFVCKATAEIIPAETDDYRIEKRIDRFQCVRGLVLDLVDSPNLVTSEQAYRLGVAIAEDLVAERTSVFYPQALAAVAKKCPDFVEGLAGCYLPRDRKSIVDIMVYTPLAESIANCQIYNQLYLHDDLLPCFAEHYTKYWNEGGRKWLHAEWPRYGWALPSAASSFLSKVKASPELTNPARVLSLIQGAFDICHKFIDTGEKGSLDACVKILRAAAELQRSSQLDPPKMPGG